MKLPLISELYLRENSEPTEVQKFYAKKYKEHHEHPQFKNTRFNSDTDKLKKKK